MLNIHPIPAFNDNYIWAIYDSAHCVVVDPGDAKPVEKFLADNKLTLVNILITHHHADHTGGILKLKKAYPHAHVFGPDNSNIKGIDTTLKEGQKISLFSEQLSLDVLEVPGHTLDHIAYHNQQWLFCGDTLFSAGCGRMFEGTAEVFWNSLLKLRKLDPKTKVYCTHEYTLANIKFAKYADTDNQMLDDYSDWATSQRQASKPTLPSTIEEQQAINPFLRCDDPSFAKRTIAKLSLNDQSAADVFAGLRAAKDVF